ncbi:uncharacterized protein LOC122048254 [Zingiber officinale]|uniref:uncharacterized protein LOC122048254 n=1 Tax=Zingiber officinale TaxID=94328 RepID=UPI001C4C0FCE|nr:uncharacterized protein LOC122048254 [Zingiber officinale]
MEIWNSRSVWKIRLTEICFLAVSHYKGLGHKSPAVETTGGDSQRLFFNRESLGKASTISDDRSADQGVGFSLDCVLISVIIFVCCFVEALVVDRWQQASPMCLCWQFHLLAVGQQRALIEAGVMTKGTLIWTTFRGGYFLLYLFSTLILVYELYFRIVPVFILTLLIFFICLILIHSIFEKFISISIQNVELEEKYRVDKCKWVN